VVTINISIGNSITEEKEKKREREMVGGECYSNAPILNSSSGFGHVMNIGGVNSYVTGSPLAIFAILLVSDVYGIQLTFSLQFISLFLCLNNSVPSISAFFLSGFAVTNDLFRMLNLLFTKKHFTVFVMILDFPNR